VHVSLTFYPKKWSMAEMINAPFITSKLTP